MSHRDPITHDYSASNRYWGHDYVYEPKPGGMEAQLLGFGLDVQPGDWLILQNGQGTTRYRVEMIRYFRDPPDQFDAVIVFDPRSK